jgi:hypothetical protein
MLAPNGPAYKAIVIYGQTRITPAASAALLRFAEAGLPIFILGSAPNITIGARGQEAVSDNMARLTNGSFSRVRILPAADFRPEMLAKAGILPRIAVMATDGAANASQLFGAWRSKPDTGLELVYLLNRGPETTFHLSFDTSEKVVPYVLDAWTGEQVPLVAYVRSEGRISVSLDLAQRQSAVFAFTTPTGEDAVVPLHVVTRSANLARLRVNGDGRIEGLIGDVREANALLSNNTEVVIPAIESRYGVAALPTVTLGPWSLTVESYAAPAALSTSSVSANRTTITISSPLQSLVPWTRIRGLERTSGVGTYRTSFKLPSQPNYGTEVRYTLHSTGRVLNSIRVLVNGRLVPAIDPSAPAEGRDITELLKDGKENEVVVEVASTLFNAVKARMTELKSVGKGVQVPRYYTQVDWAEFGLVGEVVIKTWRRVLLS